MGGARGWTSHQTRVPDEGEQWMCRFYTNQRRLHWNGNFELLFVFLSLKIEGQLMPILLPYRTQLKQVETFGERTILRWKRDSAKEPMRGFSHPHLRSNLESKPDILYSSALQIDHYLLVYIAGGTLSFECQIHGLISWEMRFTDRYAIPTI